MTKQAKVFKIADPIFQSLMFIVLAYTFDTSNYYKMILPAILCWQAVSMIIHFFIHSRSKLAKERLVFLLVVALAAGAWFLINSKKLNLPLQMAQKDDGTHIPVVELATLGTEAVIAIWYYLICIREIRHVLKRYKKQV